VETQKGRKITKITKSLAGWLFELEPVKCQVCFRWLLRKNATYRQITTGGVVPLCPECDRAIFRSIEPEQRN
jgi:hypothetical protein